MNETEQHSHEFQITIDREHFTVAQESLTGAELRDLPKPSVGEDRDLFEEVKGPGDDILIENATVVEMRNGLHFFTAPHTITPG